ncbi:MerR family transcriptional regulator [Streptomyces sp. NBC_01257]|uniref:MerR family transcriptional regulator n=1 Tax=Streptomyces sp. NBC_01257 TaxID=2903799 RepID=UPI002DD8C8FB|nr:MerR family transcriptional regulator [Streptomyces sp. NBC_01257]WRZ64550.1 MerR family transcriptional regulator [Streptomyces sp. NBC_01257]
MRIGEIAALVGLTPRAVRHYHRIGLLAEPARRANGYRSYTVRDAVLLARIRRLTELGLGLDEVREVLAEDAGRALRDVLRELDADLARQEREIRERRLRLARLLEGPVTGAGPVSPALAELLAAGPVTDSPAAAKDREHLELLDSAVGDSGIFAVLHTLAADPAVLGLYEELDALETAAVDDPRIAPLAGRMVALMPPEVLAAIPDSGPVRTGFEEALLADYPPAQAEVVRRVMTALAEHMETRGRTQP